MTKIRVANHPTLLAILPIPCVEITGDFMIAPLTWATLDEIRVELKSRSNEWQQYYRLFYTIEQALSFASTKAKSNPNPHLWVGHTTLQLRHGKPSGTTIENGTTQMCWLYEVNLEQVKQIKVEAQEWAQAHPSEIEEYLLSRDRAVKVLA